MHLSPMQREKLVTIVRRGLMAVVYCGLFFASAIGVMIISRSFPLPIENWIEIYQEILLLVCAGVFFGLARGIESERGGLLLIGGFFASLLIREMDAVFDVVHHSFWQVILLAFWATLAVGVRRAGLSSSIEGVHRFVAANQFLLMCVGVAMVLVFSRMFGAHWLWSLYIDHYPSFHTAKRLAEEALELLGYLLCVTSAIGYTFERRDDY